MYAHYQKIKDSTKVQQKDEIIRIRETINEINKIGNYHITELT